jgi:hypothetical protein
VTEYLAYSAAADYKRDLVPHAFGQYHRATFHQEVCFIAHVHPRGTLLLQSGLSKVGVEWGRVPYAHLLKQSDQLPWVFAQMARITPVGHGPAFEHHDAIGATQRFLHILLDEQNALTETSTYHHDCIDYFVCARWRKARRWLV